MRRETWYRLLPAAVIAEGAIFAALQLFLFPAQSGSPAPSLVAVQGTFLLIVVGGIVYTGHFSEFATLDSDDIREIYAVVLVGFGCLFIYAVTSLLDGFLDIPVVTRALAAEGMLIIGTIVLFAGIKGWSDHREHRESELAQARDELAGQTEQLETQRDNLDVLNQVLRHDVRNDLQLLLTYAELLEEHVDGEGEEHLETVLENTNSAIDLTKSAREIAETMRRTDSDHADVDLPRVLQSQVEEARQSHDDAVVRVAGSIPQVAVAADEMLASVFRNLLKNAIVHNDEAVPEVTVTVETDEETARVTVADNGPGIPDDQKDRIFGEGEQGLDSDGTGLGLYLVRTLVKNYGGDVWIRDRTADDVGRAHSDGGESTGAVFVVELPLAE